MDSKLARMTNDRSVSEIYRIVYFRFRREMTDSEIYAIHYPLFKKPTRKEYYESTENGGRQIIWNGRALRKIRGTRLVRWERNECARGYVKFSGVDFNAGSYDSSHAGSYPSPRVCIPERCFTKCTHCIEFNHPPQKNQFFRLVWARRSLAMLRMLYENASREKRSRNDPSPKFWIYQILSMSHDTTVTVIDDCFRKSDPHYYSSVKSLSLETDISFLFFSSSFYMTFFSVFLLHLFSCVDDYYELRFLRDLLIIRQRVISEE